jgi:hypothetical protein
VLPIGERKPDRRGVLLLLLQLAYLRASTVTITSMGKRSSAGQCAGDSLVAYERSRDMGRRRAESGRGDSGSRTLEIGR